MKTPGSHPTEAYQASYIASLAETKQNVGTDGAALNLYGLRFENNHSAAVFMQLFNAAAADVTVGTTSPTITVMVPANDGVFLLSERALRHFDRGLVVAVTAARSGNTAPGAAATAEFYYSQR